MTNTANNLPERITKYDRFGGIFSGPFVLFVILPYFIFGKYLIDRDPMLIFIVPIILALVLYILYKFLDKKLSKKAKLVSGFIGWGMIGLIIALLIFTPQLFY